MGLRLAVLCLLSMVILEARSGECGGNDLRCKADLVERATDKDWPTILAKVFDSVSSKNLRAINLILAEHMTHIRNVVRPKCPTKFYDSQKSRDLSNTDCLIDESFIRLIFLSSRLRCSSPNCENPDSANWDSSEVIQLRGFFLMWLDIIPINHGKEISLVDRNFIVEELILEKLYDFIQRNDIEALEQFLQIAKLPTLKQMHQINGGTCTSTKYRWENDLACPWEKVLNKVFLLINLHKASYADKVKRLTITIDYKEKLRLQNLKNVVEAAAMKTQGSLEQFADEIISVVNDRFDQLGDYFITLANYDKDIARADIAYIVGELEDFKDKQKKLTMKVNEISGTLAIAAISAGAADTLFAWQRAALATFSGIAAVMMGDASGLLAARDAMDDAVASTVNTVRVGTLLKIKKEVNKDMAIVFSAYERNKDHLDRAKKIVLYDVKNEDAGGIDLQAIREEFLASYNDYDPQVSTADFARLDQGWNNYIDVLESSLGEMTQAAASIIKGVLYGKNMIEEMKLILPQMTALLESRFEYQFELMDTLAIYLRAKLAQDSVEKLTDSIQEMRDDANSQALKLERHQAALSTLIISRIHTLQAVVLQCNTLEYRDAGEMPKVCQDAIKTLSDSAVSDVIAYLPASCVVNTADGAYVSIPTTNTMRRDAINLQELYGGIKTTFRIPDAQWLVDHGWRLKSEAEESVFYVKGFEIFLLSQEELSNGRHVGINIWARGAAPLVKVGDTHNQRKYEIKPTQRYRFEYRENIPPKCDKSEINPYEFIKCNKRLSDICTVKDGQIDNELDMYPSIFSEWEIQVPDLNKNTKMPKIIEGEYAPFLQAKIIFCSKRPDKRPEIDLQDKEDHSSENYQRCADGRYFDRKTFQWRRCPNGSHVALGGYYCAPDN